MILYNNDFVWVHRCFKDRVLKFKYCQWPSFALCPLLSVNCSKTFVSGSSYLGFHRDVLTSFNRASPFILIVPLFFVGELSALLHSSVRSLSTRPLLSSIGWRYIAVRHILLNTIVVYTEDITKTLATTIHTEMLQIYFVCTIDRFYSKLVHKSTRNNCIHSYSLELKGRTWTSHRYQAKYQQLKQTLRRNLFRSFTYGMTKSNDNYIWIQKKARLSPISILVSSISLAVFVITWLIYPNLLVYSQYTLLYLLKHAVKC